MCTFTFFSQVVQTPALEEYRGQHQYISMALDWAILHKRAANAQTKKPHGIHPKGMTIKPILCPWLTGNSRLRALHPLTSTESVTLPLYQEEIYRYKTIFLLGEPVHLSKVAHFWHGRRREQVLQTYYYGIVSFINDFSFKQIITFILKNPLLFQKLSCQSAFIGGGRSKVTYIS